jgi:hypothetical protein
VARDSMETLAKMLAVAESATNDGEREAANERALAWAASRNLDMAVARQRQRERTDGRKPEVPEERKVEVAPYGKEQGKKLKADLLMTVARAYDCTCTLTSGGERVWVLGFPSDLDVVERLYAHLVTQMVSQATEAIWVRRENRKLDPPVDGRTYRMNYYEGFIRDIRMRLDAARTTAEAQGGGAEQGTALAIRDKQATIQEEFDKLHGNIKVIAFDPAPKSRDYDAMAHGAAAASRVQLTVREDVGSGQTRPAIG